MPRTLEDIIPPSRRKASQREGDSPLGFVPPGGVPREKHKRNFPYKPAVVAGIVILLAIGALYLMSGATVEIDPMTNSAPLSLTLTAYASSTSKLPFALVSLTKQASQEVARTGTQKVSRIASGELTIYNTTSRSQRLIKNTRFASPNGLIFRIHHAVTVPAAHGIIPGSITVTVYADAPGSDYNVPPSPFSVPGLAGTSLENKIYAKSSMAMSGGYVGESPTIDPAVARSAQDTLHKALLADLEKSISNKVPSGYVFIPGAATTTFAQEPSETASTSGMALVREKGTMTAVVFPEISIAKTIEAHLSGSYAGQPVHLVNPQSLTLTPLNVFPTTKTQSFSFSLSGNVVIAWVINPTQIASAIAGKTRSEANTIISTFPSVKKAIFDLKPFWVSTFPTDPTKITVIVHKPSVPQSNP